VKKGLFICFLLYAQLFGATYTVDDDGPSDFNSIQAAINYSWHGDTVIVKTGIYNENIFFNGRAITVKSENPDDPCMVESTVIDPDTGYSVRFDFGEDSNSILIGIKINKGIYCYYSTPTIEKNIIAKDGYMYIISGYNSAPTIRNNTILGGITNCNGVISNNLISKGSVGLEKCYGLIINNTIVGHGNYGITHCEDAEVTNNIIAFNGTGISYPCNSSYNAFWMNNTNLGGGATSGIGDIVVNPLFAIDGYWVLNVWVDGEYHLKSEAGRWDPNTEAWVIDTVTSPCIDAGDPCDSIGYEPNPNGGRINMGAYGGTWQASKSTGGTGPEPPPFCTENIEGDVNHDCKIDFTDLAIMSNHWLDCNLEPPSACWE